MAYINKNDVAQIRKELKEAFPKFKFGVRKDNGLAVDVTIKSGPANFNSIFTHGRGYTQVNQYHLGNYGEHAEFLGKVMDIIKTAPARGEGYHKGTGYYDRSDAMTDYFDTAYYIHLNIGSWNTPYEVK